MHRRTVLVLCGMSAMTAGCLGVDPPTAAPGDDNSDGDAIVPSADVELINSGCGGPDDDQVSVVESEEGIVINGISPAPNPCHEPVISNLIASGSTLNVTVSMESTLGADEACMQCHGAITYEMVVDLGDLVVETIVVDHDEGEQHEVSL